MIDLNSQVRVGVASWIFNPSGYVLLGLRHGSHGDGMWAPPGGHIECDETPIMTAVRETAEETGMQLNPENVKEFTFTNDIFPDKHYITIHCITQIEKNINPILMEPNKCEQWMWVHPDDFPKNLFLPILNLLKKTTIKEMACAVK